MNERVERGEVLVTIVGVIGDEVVEAELVDVDGEGWRFVASSAVLGAPTVGPGAIRCAIVRDEMVGGILIVHIDTSDPDGVVSVDGVSRFRVLRALVL